MDAQMLDWSDVPYILAVCEAGSLSAAAKQLGVNHSTVFRRVEAVEARLGVRLFERRSRGYVMMPAGERFHQLALSLRDDMNAIQREISGRDLRLEGPLRVTTTDSLLHALAPVFMAFQDQHPEVELRLIAAAEALDLMQRDADVALRPTSKPPEHWVGRRVAPIVCAAYAHVDYLRETRSSPERGERWIRLGDDLDRSPMSRLAMRLTPKDARTSVVSTMMGVFEMTRAGLGIAAMPCYLGDACPDLAQVHPPDASDDWDLWLLVHPDVRRSARVHAFFEFAAKHVPERLPGAPEAV